MKQKLYTLFILLLCGMATFSQEQAPDWAWAKSAGGSNDDYGKSIATDAAGNVYITGSFASDSITFGNITLTNAYTIGCDIFIVKYNPNGNVLWAQSAGGDWFDYGTSLAIDAVGNIYLTGVYSSTSINFGNYTFNNPIPKAKNIFIVKYDPNGNVLWAQSADGSGEGTGIATDIANNIYITGYFSSSTITFGNITLTNEYTVNSDIFLVKYDSNGNVLWAKSAGGISSDNSNSITIDTSGNVYITGFFDSQNITFGTITLTKTNYGSNGDVFITKYDPVGNVLWAKSAGGGIGSSSHFDDEGKSITTDALGNVYITGDFYYLITFGNITLTTNYSLYADIFIAKYDPDGNILWAKSVDGGDDEGNSITTDVEGNVYLSGNFSSPILTLGNFALFNAYAGYGNIFIAKYDPDGNVLWAKSVDGSDYNEGNSITTDVEGNVYLTGDFNDTTLTFGNSTLTNAGSSDIFIARLDLNTGNNSPVIEGCLLTLTVSANPEATFTWSGPNGFTSTLQNPTVSNSATSSMSGTYDVMVTLNGISGTGSTYVTVYNAPIAGNNGPVCSDDRLALTASTIPDATYNWTGPNGFTSNEKNPVVNNHATLAMAGLYTVTATLTVNGCTSIPGSTNVIVNPLPSIPIAGNNGPACNGSLLSLTASTILDVTYHWIGPNGFTSTLQNPIVSDSATTAMSGTYQVTVSFSNGCTSQISSTNVMVTTIIPKPYICLVSVDSVAEKGIVIWNKPVSGAISYFNIYREDNEINGYNFIGTVPYDSVSIYTDTSSNPSQQAYNYKISAVDTCGNESALSPNHKSLHLTLSQGIGSYYILTWSCYEGFSCTTYNIYRGSSPTNLSLLATVPISPNTYTDLTPPAGDVYYQIEAVKSNPCSPQGNYNSARSNIVSNNVNAVPEYPNESGIRIYPNPANDELIINISAYSAVNHTTLKLFNIYGKLLKSVTITGNATTIDVSNYPVGIYIIRFMDKKGVVAKRIVKK